MADTVQALIVFTPSGKRGHFAIGTPVLQAARELGVDIDSVCGGRARCGRCRVLPVEGHFAKEGIVSAHAHLNTVGESEQRRKELDSIDAKLRLSCQAKIQGDIVIDVPADSQVHHQVIRKEFEAHDIDVDPVVHLYFIEIADPDLHNPADNLERLLHALEHDWQLAGLSWDTSIEQELQDALRAGAGQITTAIRHGNRLVAIWPGLRRNVYGVALDVGTTSIAVNLCDLGSGEVLGSAGAMNPQIRFGEDVMSRVSYAMRNPGGDRQMTEAVRSAINSLIHQVAADSGVSSTDILEMSAVGNPVMHHLLLGIDPTPLGTSPFTLATDGAVDVPAGQLDIDVHPNGRVYVLPCIAGHVGADAAAVLLAETPYNDDVLTLIIDVGTNAEIFLGNRGRLLAASSPTGPAFEGAQISGGQRAARGAIERVRINRKTLEPRFKIIGSDLWSDDPQFTKQPDQPTITGICGSGIIEAIAEMYLAGIVRADGIINGKLAEHSDRIVATGRTFAYQLHRGAPQIIIQQNDVRAIQLAKAALYAGIHLLMERMDVDKVDRIRLAGAFGSYIDVRYAMLLGMIPDCDPECISPAGNAAGTGARMALLSASARREIEQRVGQIEKIETAVADNFQQFFVDAMNIPHRRHPFSGLSRLFDLPVQTSIAPERAGRHRRRK